MSEPVIKRFRIQDITRQISDQTLQNFARTALESARSLDSQPNGDAELKRKYRRTNLLKTTSIRPLPLSNFHEPFKYSVTKQPLGNVIFGHHEEYTERMGPKYECHVYEFKHQRKLTFFPIVTGPKFEQLFACVDCFCVYSIMTVLRNRLETIPVCKYDELGSDKDPLKLPHYCTHLDSLSKAQKLYFKQYYYQYKPTEHKLIEHAFNIGMFVKKMCSYDTKTAKFCQESEGQDESSMIHYIQGLDYTLKEESHAKSFLEVFKTLHKDEITTDEQGRIQIEGIFESSQEPSDSQSSQGSLSSSQQRLSKRNCAPPNSTLNSIKSIASTLTPNPTKATTPTDSLNDKQAHSSQEESQPALNGISDLRLLQDLVCGLNGNADSQPTNQAPELDLKQFVAGLLMSTMTTVSNPQLQVLYDGLRPLVARYAPDCLSQFITIIHKIDRNMPSELSAVNMNNVAPRIPDSTPSPRIITTTTQPTNQNLPLPKILRRIVTTHAGTSKSPITLDGEDSKNPNIFLPQ